MRFNERKPTLQGWEEAKILDNDRQVGLAVRTDDPDVETDGE